MRHAFRTLSKKWGLTPSWHVEWGLKINALRRKSPRFTRCSPSKNAQGNGFWGRVGFLGQKKNNICLVEIKDVAYTLRMSNANQTTAIENLEDEVSCKKCQSKVNWLAVFPGGICVDCHSRKYNSSVLRNGGILPVPNFKKAIR